MKKRGLQYCIFLGIVLFLSCSKEAGTTYTTRYMDPVYPDLVLTEISDFRPESLDRYRIRHPELNYQGSKPLFFSLEYSNYISAFDDDTGQLLWVSQVEIPSSPSKALGIFDYKGQLLIFTLHTIYLVNVDNGDVLEEIAPDVNLDRAVVNGFTCVDDKVYVLTTTTAGSQSLLELFEFDLEQKVGVKLYEKAGISGMNFSKFILSTDENKDHFYFVSNLTQWGIQGTYIFKINRNTGEETLILTGVTIAEDPSSQQNPWYCDDKFVYQTSRIGNTVFSLPETRILINIKEPNVYFHCRYYFTWSTQGSFQAYTFGDFKPIWSEAFVSHIPEIINQPLVHPDQDIVCIHTKSGLQFIEILSGRILYVFNLPFNFESMIGARINGDGSKLFVFTNRGGILTYDWPF